MFNFKIDFVIVLYTTSLIDRDAVGGRHLTADIVTQVIQEFRARPGKKCLTTIIGTNNVRRHPENLPQLKRDFEKLFYEFLDIPDAHLVFVGLIPSLLTDEKSKGTFVEASNFLKVVFSLH